MNDRAHRAGIEAGRVDAVLARITHEQPARLRPVGAKLLDEFDVAPVGGAQLAGIVIRLTREAANYGEQNRNNRFISDGKP